jgi:probable rRNA maturation factor
MSPEGPSHRRAVSGRRRPVNALRILVRDGRGAAGAAPGLARWLARVAPVGTRGTVSLAIVSDQRMRRLNQQYLGRDYATDVLSFPADKHPTRAQRHKRSQRSNKARTLDNGVPQGVPAGRSSPSSASSASSSLFLGDIAIGHGVARRQARVAGHSDATELRVLALHGLLHLLGYDHERDRGEMYQLEQRLRRKGGLREGLIERRQTTRPSPGAPGQGRTAGSRARQR